MVQIICTRECKHKKIPVEAVKTYKQLEAEQHIAK
jgi:hypothetical protein